MGSISQAFIIAEFLKHDFNVLLPVQEYLRYDLVLEKDGVFTRVQCKTAHSGDGIITFRTESTHNRRRYDGDADLFAIYNHETNRVYVIPVEGCLKV